MKKLALMMLCAMLTVMGYAEKFTSGGQERNIIVYAPSGLPQNRPLLISLHGSSQSASYQSEHAQFELVADTAKFVVVYPDGLGSPRGWDLSTNRDITFITDIIDEMVKRYKIDRNRVYLSGFSMGGMMTYFAMNKIADKIAAFAPCSGYLIGGPNATASRPIPILHVHGTGDDVCTYSPVQNHINAWVKFNGCSTTAKVEKPKTGPANTTAEMIRYMGGKNGVEVAHLKLPNKGHWHSNDPVMAMSNIEIWNFCSRWSLTPGPELVSVTPEDGSFDLSTEEDRTFTFTFDKPVDCSRVSIAMSDGMRGISFVARETGYSKTITYDVKSGTTLQDVEYRMQLKNLYSEDGGQGSNQVLYYTYGVQSVGETLKIDTLLTQDWYSQKSAIQEGIPVGWHRINSNSSGSDDKTSGAANTGGARMKYFTPGGDFDAGFYFCAREYDQCTFTYGEYTPKLSLKRGHYMLSFRSAYWNANAQTNKDKFSVQIIRESNGNSIYSASGLTPKGCLNEKSDVKVTGSNLHELEFEAVLTSPTNYLLQYQISNGWNGIILGPPTITRCPSQAERYKGEFLRLLHRAQQAESKLKEGSFEGYSAQIATLYAAIGQYESLVSTAPSVYTAAMQELQKALQPVEALGMKTVSVSSASQPLYDLLGRRVTGTPRGGIFVQGGKKVIIR